MKTLLSILLLLTIPAQAGTLKKIGELKVTRPAFLSIHDDQLIVTQFGVFHKGKVSILKGLKSNLENLQGAQFKTFIDDSKIKWPNEVRFFGEDRSQWAGTVSSGFLVPGKTNGGVFLLNNDILSRFRSWFGVDLQVNVPFFRTALTRISPKDKGWWYHRTRPYKDGFITARAKLSWGNGQGELLYLYRENNTGSKWLSEKIVSGPDVHFQLYDFDKDGEEEIICTEFFNKRLTMLKMVDGEWEYTVIDDTVGAAFDLEVRDLDLDGTAEVLVPNHEADEKAAVLVYTVNTESGIEFTRHTILEGIKTIQGGIGSASPGKAEGFIADSNNPTKPWVLVNGDGSQKAHLLKPKSEDANNWEYTEEILIDTGCTVGQSAIADIDGDGGVEIFIPAYDKDLIHVFSYVK